MKKIISILAAAVIALTAVPALAANSGISVRSDDTSAKAVSYRYDDESGDETVRSVKSLLTNLDNLTSRNTVSQTITVTSESVRNYPVDVSLRIMIPENWLSTSSTSGIVRTPTPQQNTALDYYNVKVTAQDGAVIYDYEEEPSVEAGDIYKEIPLGTFNLESGSESRQYNIAVSANSALNQLSVINNAKNLDWSIVSRVAEDKKDTSATAGPETTQPVSEETPAAAATAEHAPAVTPAAIANGIRLQKGEYTVGEDIVSGRYRLTGEGKVNVYKKDGAIKTTVVLKSLYDTSASGSTDYIVSLEDGERLEVASQATLTPYTAPSTSPRPSVTPSAKPTSTPKASESPKPSATPKATTAPASGTKSNPKTGDNAPITAMCVIGITALAGAVLITVKKRRMN